MGFAAARRFTTTRFRSTRGYGLGAAIAGTVGAGTVAAPITEISAMATETVAPAVMGACAASGPRGWLSAVTAAFSPSSVSGSSLSTTITIAGGSVLSRLVTTIGAGA